MKKRTPKLGVRFFMLTKIHANAIRRMTILSRHCRHAGWQTAATLLEGQVPHRSAACYCDDAWRMRAHQ